MQTCLDVEEEETIGNNRKKSQENWNYQLRRKVLL